MNNLGPVIANRRTNRKDCFYSETYSNFGSLIMTATMSFRSTILLAGVALACGLFSAHPARAAWVSYHDFGATIGFQSTGNITTHQVGASNASANTLDTTPKNLIRYSDGSVTGVTFSIAGANGMDSRNGGETGPPAAATPAAVLFNIPGLNLSNGMIYEGGTNGTGATTFTLTNLNPNALYDLAFYGDRNLGADGLERFVLGGADAATNISSTGIFDAFTTDQQTRPNAATGHVIRWTDINPGADGIITVTMDPEFTSANNIAYLNAMRLEELPEPTTITMGLLGVLGFIGLLWWPRRKQRC